MASSGSINPSGSRQEQRKTSSSEEARPDTANDLSDLLEDALNDFDAVSRRPAAQEKILTEEQPATSTSAREDSRPPKFDPLRTAPKARAKGRALEPLAKAPRKAAGLQHQHQQQQQQPQQPEGQFGAVPPDVSDMDDELTKGLERLMKELAQVDMGQDGQPNGAPRPNQQHAATLQALSDTQAALRQSAGLPAAAPDSSNPAGFDAAGLAGLSEQFSRDGGGDALGSFADGIMQQLLSKEVLYQPMRDIAERYPAWLEAHRSELPPGEMRKYEEQYEHIQAILHIYEHHPDDYPRLFGALQQMQACGQPPQDIVNDLAPGLSLDEDGLPLLPQPGQGGEPPGCSLQ